MLKRTLYALSAALCLMAFAIAQDIQIAYQGPGFTFDEVPQGALILPQESQQPAEVLTGPVLARSADGSASYRPGNGGSGGYWQVDHSQSGRYDFYLAAREAGPDYLWSSEIRVEVRVLGNSYSFTPPPGNGSVWHVCSIVGVSGELTEVGRLLPGMRLIYGVVRDAATGKPMERAKVSLLSPPKYSQISSVLTNKDGKYSLFAPAEGLRFSLEISDEGSIAIKERIDYLKEDYPRRIDAALSSALKNSQYRFVLCWGDRPVDLDAHLVGPDLSGALFHISFRNMRSWSGRHFLDVDDMDGYGPETITLTRLDNGTYDFYVHDWTNQSKAGSGALAASGAKVKVYREASLIGEFSVPKGLGTIWKVCSINGSTGELLEEGLIQ